MRPCKSLGPVLEKLEVEYAGRFKLAKIDSDGPAAATGGHVRHPQHSHLRAAQERPARGRIHGRAAEGQVRAFLDKHVPSEGALEAEADVDEAHELLESGDTQAALSKMADALAADPPTTTPALTTCAC